MSNTIVTMVDRNSGQPTTTNISTSFAVFDDAIWYAKQVVCQNFVIWGGDFITAVVTNFDMNSVYTVNAANGTTAAVNQRTPAS